MKDVVAQFLDEAVRFVPRNGRRRGQPIRVARTLLTCGVAAAVMNELRLPEEAGPAYRYVNVHNPRCPLSFDRERQCWRCSPALQQYPAWGLNWAAAQALCEHLGGRLPWAEEWERFASNNDPARIYPWGNAAPDRTLANYDEHYGGPSAVGCFPPSETGLCDLAGNLGEWCLDRFGEAKSLERLVKGGAWSKDADHLRIARSRGKWARLGTTTIGLRPVWED